MARKGAKGWLKDLEPIVDTLYYGDKNDINVDVLESWYTGSRPAMTPNHFWLLCVGLYGSSFSNNISPLRKEINRKRFLLLLDEHDKHHCTKEPLSTVYTPVYVDGWLTAWKAAKENADRVVMDRLTTWLTRERALQYIHFINHPKYGRTCFRPGCRSGDLFFSSFQVIANLLLDGKNQYNHNQNEWNQPWFRAPRKLRDALDKEIISVTPIQGLSEAVGALKRANLGGWYPYEIKVAPEGVQSGFRAFQPNYAHGHLYGVDTFQNSFREFRVWEEWLAYRNTTPRNATWHLIVDREGTKIIKQPTEITPPPVSQEKMIEAIYRIYVLNENRQTVLDSLSLS